MLDLQLDAHRIAHPRGMDARGELIIGLGMGGAVTAAQRARQGPLGAAAQVSGRVALRMHARVAIKKRNNSSNRDGWCEAATSILRRRSGAQLVSPPAATPAS